MIVREDLPPTPEWVLPERVEVEQVTIPPTITLGEN